MEPILFVTIGSSINFHTLPSGTVPKSILVVGVGACKWVYLGLQLDRHCRAPCVVSHG